jgi:hypothetical protein
MSCTYNFNLKQKKTMNTLLHLFLINKPFRCYVAGRWYSIEDNLKNKRTAIALISIVLTEFCY